MTVTPDTDAFASDTVNAHVDPSPILISFILSAGAGSSSKMLLAPVNVPIVAFTTHVITKITVSSCSSRESFTIAGPFTEALIDHAGTVTVPHVYV